MNVFSCTTRCFYNGKLYEPMELLRSEEKQIKHFKIIDTLRLTPPDEPPAVPRRKKKKKED